MVSVGSYVKLEHKGEIVKGIVIMRIRSSTGVLYGYVVDVEGKMLACPKEIII